MKSFEFPFVLVNFKTYEEAMGMKAIKLSAIAEKVSKDTGTCIAVAPEIVDLSIVLKTAKIPVFSQHIDPIRFGKFTGHVLPEAVALAGCTGTLINHSERRVGLKQIESTIKRAKEVGLIQVVCVDTVERSKAIAVLDPDIIAIEPPELIGTGISGSKARPEVVSETVEAINKINSNIKVLCGAGITNGNDIATAINLGVEGILVASGIVKSNSPYEKLYEMAKVLSINE
jgi:triosephosphate isomerase